MTNVKKEYKRIKHNLHIDYGPFTFIKDLYKYIANDSNYFHSTKKIYIRKFLEHFIFNNDSDIIQAKAIYKAIEQACEEIDQYNECNNQELMQLFSNAFTLEYDHSLNFLPPFIQFVKNNDALLFGKIKYVLFYILLDYQNLKLYVHENNNALFSNAEVQLKDLSVCQKLIFGNFIKNKEPEIIDEIPTMMRVIFFFLENYTVERYLESYLDVFSIKELELKKSKKIKSDYIDVYLKRHDFVGQDRKTLEEIGLECNVTRERVRQICKKLNFIVKDSLLLKIKQTHMSTLVEDIYYSISNDSKYPYITLECMDKYLKKYKNKDDILLLICLIEDNSLENIKYDKDCKIFYDANIFNINEFINLVLEQYGDIVKKDEFAKIHDQMTKLVIQANYRERETAYIKSGITKASLVKSIIEKYFSKGIEVNQLKLTEDTEKLCKIFYDLSGEELGTSERGVYASILRSGVMAIDRSRYNLFENCVRLDDENLTRIFAYIDSNGPVVLYKSIFYKFKKELHKIGINNYYYLKSVLDIKLRELDKYGIERDYIKVDSGDLTFYGAVKETIISFPEIFSLDDITSKFEGVEDNVINTIIAGIPSIIYMGQNKYIDIDKLAITERISKDIYDTILGLFEELNTKCLSINIVFERLLIKNYYIFEELPEIDDETKMFSVINYLFSSNFAFRRPFIAVSDDDLFNSTELVLNYARSKNSFTHDDIINFTEEMQIRNIEYYSTFLQDLSKEYVQYDKGSMIKKECFTIPNGFIDNLYQSIVYYISSFGIIDTETFKGYSSLPSCSIEWNKYLLVGIIRCYLDDKLDIEQTSNAYDITDYKIRRKK